MLLNALAGLGHRGLKTISTFGRAGLMLFNALVGKPEFRKHCSAAKFFAPKRIKLCTATTERKPVIAHGAN